MTTCRIHEKINYIIGCQREALEGDPDGLCLMHSRRNEKDQDEIFTRAVKDQIAREDYNFSGVFFPGMISFGKHDFSNPANFSWTTFTKKADFSGSTFAKGVFFNGATFNDRAYFAKTTFIGKTIFNAATFSKMVNFIGAIFKERTIFAGVTFAGSVNFTVVKIEGQLLFYGLNPSREGKRVPVFQGGFLNLDLEPEAVLRFQDLSLEKVIFQGSDLRKIEFRHVQWPPYRGRQTIYDEILLKKDENKKPRFLARFACHAPYDASFKSWPARYGEVERLYRYLKINYETQGDYKNAGDFHYGEMEMHRRASPWRRWGSLYSAYWALNGYGERPLRAFIWLLLLIPAWAGLVWGLGIDQAGSQHPISYWDTLLFIFEKATLQRPPWTDMQNINWLGKLLASLSVLLLPGQAALFILALRNRLGRRR